MAFHLRPLPLGSVIVPCKQFQPFSLFVCADAQGKPVPTICNHTAWTRECIVTHEGYIVHTIAYPERTQQESVLARLLPGLFSHPEATPVWCTRCDLEERLTAAAVCAWCHRIIFVGDAATLTHDDRPVIDLRAPHIVSAWEKQVLVCHRASCAERFFDQHASLPVSAPPQRSGVWHERCALLLTPR